MLSASARQVRQRNEISNLATHLGRRGPLLVLPVGRAGHATGVVYMGIEAVDDYLLDDLFTDMDFNLTDVSDHVPWPIPLG